MDGANIEIILEVGGLIDSVIRIELFSVILEGVILLL